MELRVGLNEQDHVRDVESAVNTLYAKWHTRFPQKSDMELLAMLTYQYASFYFAMRDRESHLTRSVNELSGKVQEALDEALPDADRSHKAKS